jgi:hypothetical protein
MSCRLFYSVLVLPISLVQDKRHNPSSRR